MIMSREYSHIKETRREFIREKRRQLKIARAACRGLHLGCALDDLFDGTSSYMDAVNDLRKALNKIDEITKPLS
jgi:hypothetical protein